MDLADDEKRRRLIAQIEKTAEEIRQIQKGGVLEGDYAQLFLLHPRSSVYVKHSEKTRVKMAAVWLLAVLFLVSLAVVAVFVRRVT